MSKNYGRELLAMDDDELERFVNDWLTRRKESYVEHERFSGSGDMGRDVVGYCTVRRMDGAWHNYQCKQLGKKPLCVREVVASPGPRERSA